MSHHYLSTACMHEGESQDEDLHLACRKTCKFCDAPCECPRHRVGEPAAQVSAAWVDQARDMARELLSYGHPGHDCLPTELLERIRSDPDLFWLRGQETPPGRPYEGHGNLQESEGRVSQDEITCFECGEQNGNHKKDCPTIQPKKD